MKKLTQLAAAIALASVGVAAQAEVSANVGVTSNYLWRGVTQSADGPSVSGGVDYSNESGFYAGAWIGSIDWSGDGSGNATENDYYFGFSGEAGDIGYDVGYIYYSYPATGYEDSDFGEIYGSVSVMGFDLGLAYTVNSQADDDAQWAEGDMYYSVGYGFELPEEYSLGLSLGYYDFDVPSSSDVNYMHYQIDLSKGDFTFTLSKAEEESGDDDTKFVVSWGTSF